MYILFIILLALSNLFYFNQRINFYKFENYNIYNNESHKLLLLLNLSFIPMLWYTNSSYIGLIILGYILVECFLITFIDLKYCEITHTSISLLGLLSVMYLLIYNQFSIEHLISGIILFILFFIFYLIFNVGGGDVKLAFSIGLFFKPYHLLDYLILIFSLSLIISIIVIIYCKIKKINSKDVCIPFAPFMIIGLLCYLI